MLTWETLQEKLLPLGYTMSRFWGEDGNSRYSATSVLTRPSGTPGVLFAAYVMENQGVGNTSGGHVFNFTILSDEKDKRGRLKWKCSNFHTFFWDMRPVNFSFGGIGNWETFVEVEDFLKESVRVFEVLGLPLNSIFENSDISAHEVAIYVSSPGEI